MSIKAFFYDFWDRITERGEQSAEDLEIQGDFENENAFLESLNQLTPDDIAPEIPKTTGEKVHAWLRTALVIIFAATFLTGAGMLITKAVHQHRANAVYSELAGDIFNKDLSNGGIVSRGIPHPQMSPMPDYHSGLDAVESGEDVYVGSYNVKFEQMKSNLTYLKSINPDIYGYVHIEGTRISFPIVKGADNDYYLDHAYNGEYMVCGSIFADYRADDNFANNRNTVFYGHNMLDGNMFNNVMLFKDEEIFNTKLIEIYTFDGIYTFEPFAIFQTVRNFPYFRMSFSSDEDFVGFCEKMQGQSLLNKEMTFTGEDKIITLSTCTPSDDVSSAYVGRYALHARLIKVER